MNWYYAANGQQMGPVSDMEFTTLVRDGVIQPSTLVWQEGMPQWVTLEKARPDLLTTTNAPVVAGMQVAEENKDILVQQLREGAVIPAAGTVPNTDLRYAGFWIRVAAKLIDWVVLFVPIFIISFGLGMGMAAANPEDFENNPQAATAFMAGNLAITLGSWILVVGYNCLMVWKWGGTLGKLAVGIRVVTQDAQKVTLGRSVGRGFAELISGSFCQFLYLMVAFDEPQKRALHDHICATRVVYK